MPQDPVTRDPGTLLQRALDAWRSELSELGGPDTLLAHRDVPLGTLDLSTAHPSGLAGFLAGRPTRLSDLFREQTVLEAARESARHLRVAAARLTDGYGLPGSELAVGMLEWVHPESGAPIEAPVLLRPLTLRPRGSGAVDFHLDLDGPVRLNPALVRLLGRHWTGVDTASLLRLAGGHRDEFTPRRALEQLRSDLSAPGGPGPGDGPAPVVHDRTVVGLFADLGTMLADDLERVGPDLSSHRLVQALLGSGSIGVERADAPAGPVHPPRDGELTPLDPSQRAVIDLVAHGRDVRVETPVGSGSTQVAAQLVVDAARTGRSMLVVAPRRGPVDDVAARLGQYGLARLLPVATATGADNADSADSADTADTADEADNSAAGRKTAHTASTADELAARRSLHEVRPRWGISRLDVLRALARLLPGGSASADGVVRLPEATMRELAAPTAREEASRLLTEAADSGAYTEISTSSPWVGAAVGSTEEARAALAAIDRLRDGSLDRARRLMDGLAHGVGLRGGERVRDWGHQLDLFVSVRSTLDVFLPAVYERPLDGPIAATASASWRERHGRPMSRLERRRWSRQASDLVRPGMKPDDLHSALVTADGERAQWQRISGSGALPHVPSGLGEADDAYRHVVSDLSFLEARLEGTSGATELEVLPLHALHERLGALAAAREDLAVLPRRTQVLASLDRLGLTDLVEQLRAEKADREEAAGRLEIAWHRGVLSTMDQEDRGQMAPGEYGRRAESRAVPRAAAGPRATALATTALALPYLPDRMPRVDTVLLLDAQRLGLAESVAAIARGRQVVVFGDPGGLRPSALETLEDDDESTVKGRTSVLDATTGRLVTLTLDYRHRSPEQVVAIGQALAAGSGQMPRWQVPAPHGPAARLEVVPDGTVPVTAFPEEASPPEEVQRVVELVIDHVRSRPEQSLAVLTPGGGHARAVADGVRRALAEGSGITPWFTRSTDEPFVVADLARAEDTVRDHVLISLGIGRTPHGRVVHRFGRLDAEGGDRLLNLGVAQARLRLTVVSSLTADQLDPERTSSDGARAVRRLLQVLAAEGNRSSGDDFAASLGPPPQGDPVLDLLVAGLRAAGHEVGSLAHAAPAADLEPGDDSDLDFGPAPVRRKRSGSRAGPPAFVESDPSTRPDLVVRVRGGSRPVAVLWDGRRPDDDPTEVASGDLMLGAALERFGWGVARVRAGDIVADPAAAAAAVAAQAAGPAAHPADD